MGGSAGPLFFTNKGTMVKRIILAGLAATLPIVAFAQSAGATFDYWDAIVKPQNITTWAPLTDSYYGSGSGKCTSGTTIYGSGCMTTSSYGVSTSVLQTAIATPFTESVGGTHVFASVSHGGTYLYGLYGDSAIQTAIQTDAAASNTPAGPVISWCTWTGHLDDSGVYGITPDAQQALYELWNGSADNYGSVWTTDHWSHIAIQDSSTPIYSSGSYTTVNWPGGFDLTPWHFFCLKYQNIDSTHSAYNYSVDDIDLATLTGPKLNFSPEQFILGPGNFVAWGESIDGRGAAGFADLLAGYSTTPVPPLPLPVGGSTPCPPGTQVLPLSGQCKVGLGLTTYVYTPPSTQTCASTSNWWDVGADVTNAICNATNEILTGMDAISSLFLPWMDGALNEVITGINAVIDLAEPSRHVFDALTSEQTYALTKSPYREASDVANLLVLGMSTSASTGTVSMGNWGFGSWSINLNTAVFAHLDPWDTLIDGVVYLALSFAILETAKEVL